MIFDLDIQRGSSKFSDCCNLMADSVFFAIEEVFGAGSIQSIGAIWKQHAIEISSWWFETMREFFSH